ncbi:MAG: dephospho-CoA kinase [Alphaproteobacteria bacterium]
MGKSTAAAALRRLGIPVFDADQAVHALLGHGGAAVGAVGAAFPDSVDNGAINRTDLGKMVFGDKAALRRLEAILHPMVRKAERRFGREIGRRRIRLVAYDIPLLFETGGERRYDLAIVVTAPHFVQQARVLARPGMTNDRFVGIRARQIPDVEKRRRADFLIPTGMGRRESLTRLVHLVGFLARPTGSRWLAARRKRQRHA